MTIEPPPSRPKAVTRPYKITYSTFEGKTRTAVWKVKGPCYMPEKAMRRADCRTLGPVVEITEEEFEKLAAAQRCHPQILRNKNRRA
jgi:hypothetical protein